MFSKCFGAFLVFSRCFGAFLVFFWGWGTSIPPQHLMYLYQEHPIGVSTLMGLKYTVRINMDKNHPKRKTPKKIKPHKTSLKHMQNTLKHKL